MLPSLSPRLWLRPAGLRKLRAPRYEADAKHSRAASLQALIAGSGITAFVYHNSAAALVNGLFCAMLMFVAAYASHYHYRKCVPMLDGVPMQLIAAVYLRVQLIPPLHSCGSSSCYCSADGSHAAS